MKKLLRSASLILLLLTGSLSAQVPNCNFENWTTVASYQIPNDWGTLNHVTDFFGAYTATEGTTPGNNSYLKLTSIAMGGSVAVGIAVSGKLDTVSLQPKSGFAYAQRPATFGGKWQHMIYGNSQGGVKVLLTKWNSIQNKRDTIAHAETTLAGMAMSWANFSLNMQYVDSLHFPDSCIIELRASGSTPANNDYLWVDNLAFSGTVPVVTPPNMVGITKNSGNEIGLNVFPNPAKNKVSLNYNLSSANKVSIQIIDISGKVVSTVLPTTSKIGINTIDIETSKFDKGIYTIVIKTNETGNSCRLIIE